MAEGNAPTTIGGIIGNRLLQALEEQEEKLDADIERLERLEEDDLERMRRNRLAQLKKVHKQKEEWAAKGHGEYREIHDQKQFFSDLKTESRAVVHFYRPSTRRCEIMDKHLTLLARKHIETRFIRIDAEKSPFVTEKLKIWMLPTLVLIKDGKTDHSIVGFDELGGSDNFTTAQLEAVLLKHDVVMESFM